VGTNRLIYKLDSDSVGRVYMKASDDIWWEVVNGKITSFSMELASETVEELDDSIPKFTITFEELFDGKY